MGESEWQRLSEKDRQRRLIELRMKERQLRQEGREEEALQLLGKYFVLVLNHSKKKKTHRDHAE